MALEPWIAFCATEMVLCLTPGPAVLLVVSMSLARGRRAGLGAAGGILAANTLYFALSAAGVGAALATSWTFFVLLKWGGAAYLIWIGLHMLLTPTASGAMVGAPAPRAPARDRPFVRGFLMQSANPKALVFFTALLPQFIDPGASVWQQVLVLGVSSVAIELGVLALYAALTARSRRWAGARLEGRLERVGGLFLIGAGARLAVIDAATR